MEVLEKFKVTLDFEIQVDTETGEVSTKCVSKKIDKEVSKKKPKRIESSKPVLTLETNKYCLNKAAIELMGIEPDCKLEIKYERQGTQNIPVIGEEESFNSHNGNRLTKSFTVAYRGSKNEELMKYGTEFTLIPHNAKPGLFILKNENIELEKALDDTIVQNGQLEEEIDLPMDIDLQDLIDNKDANVTEITPAIFKL